MCRKRKLDTDVVIGTDVVITQVWVMSLLNKEERIIRTLKKRTQKTVGSKN